MAWEPATISLGHISINQEDDTLSGYDAMKTFTLFLVSVCLVAGCVSASNHDFVQGWIRITPPVQVDMTPTLPAADGGTLRGSFVDAKGRKFDYYIDHQG
jgi:hypothetical protein